MFDCGEFCFDCCMVGVFISAGIVFIIYVIYILYLYFISIKKQELEDYKVQIKDLNDKLLKYTDLYYDTKFMYDKLLINFNKKTGK